MEFVEPIRDKKQIEAMKRYLKGSNFRNYLLFILGINSGLRISDLLSLRVEEVRNADRVAIRERKTGKMKDFPLGLACKKAIQDYIKLSGLISGPLFPSRKGTAALGRIQAYRILSQAAISVGIKEAIGTHTLRKTFGYHAYKQGVDVTRIQKLLNHSCPSETLRYIGITKDELDDIYFKLDL